MNKIHQLTYMPYKTGKAWRAEIVFEYNTDFHTINNQVNLTFVYSTYKGYFEYSAIIDDFHNPPSKETLLYLMQYDEHFIEGIVFGIQYVMHQYVKSSNPPLNLNIKITKYGIRTISLNQSNAFCMIKGLYRALNFYPTIQPEIKNVLQKPEEYYVYIFPNVPYPPPIHFNTALTYEIKKGSVFNERAWINEYLDQQQEYYEKYCPIIEEN